MPISVQEFSAKIKQKYPQYQNIDDTTLTKKMLEKYPQYKTQVNLGNQQIQPQPPTQKTPTDFWGKVKDSALSGALQGINSVPFLQTSPADQSDIAKGTRNFKNQMVTSATNSLANQANFSLGAVEDMVNPMSRAAKMSGSTNFQSSPLSTAGNTLNQGVNQLTGAVRNKSFQENDANENSLSTIGGDVTGAIAASAPSMFGGGAATNLIKNSSYLNKLLPKANSLKNILSNVLGGTINTQGATIGQKGRAANLEELGTGAVIDSLFSGAGELTNKAGNYLFSKTVPSTITQIGKDTKRNLDIGEALSKTGISFTRKGLTKKIGTEIKKLSQTLDDEIESIVKANPNKTFNINDFTKNIKDKVLANPKLKATPLDIPDVEKAIDGVIDKAKALYEKKQLTLADVQKLKKQFNIGLEGEFNKAVGSQMRSVPAAQMELTKNLKNTIEQYVPNAKIINKKLAPLLEAIGRLEKKGPPRGLLTDILAGTGYAGYQGATGNASTPEDYVKNLLTGVLVKKIGNSTFAKTTAGTGLKSLSKNSAGMAQLLKILMPKN